MKHKKNHAYSIVMGVIIVVALLLMAVPLVLILVRTYF